MFDTDGATGSRFQQYAVARRQHARCVFGEDRDPGEEGRFSAVHQLGKRWSVVSSVMSACSIP